MKESLLMRVMFCKIHCPVICFCKPSVAHLYTSEPLKLENSTPIIVPTATAESDSFDIKSSCEGKEESVNWNKEAKCVGKSCIKKLPHIVPACTEQIVKKRVQWIDSFGEELSQIKEFESRQRGCGCLNIDRGGGRSGRTAWSWSKSWCRCVANGRKIVEESTGELDNELEHYNAEAMQS